RQGGRAEGVGQEPGRREGGEADGGVRRGLGQGHGAPHVRRARVLDGAVVTNRDCERLAEQLLPDLPGFFAKGPLAASRPVTHTLRGLYCEGSGFAGRAFFVVTFFLPLFAPTKHVSFNLGKRLRTPGGGDRWDADDSNVVAELRAAVKRDALPFVSGIESAEDIARAAAAFQEVGDPYAQQAVAYAWARAGNVARACEELERLTRLL